MGASETHPGLFHAFGFNGHGFLLGPGVGAVLTELILDGKTKTDIGGLGIGRFRPRRKTTSVAPARPQDPKEEPETAPSQNDDEESEDSRVAGEQEKQSARHEQPAAGDSEP